MGVSEGVAELVLVGVLVAVADGVCAVPGVVEGLLVAVWVPKVPVVDGVAVPGARMTASDGVGRGRKMARHCPATFVTTQGCVT